MNDINNINITLENIKDKLKKITRILSIRRRLILENQKNIVNVLTLNPSLNTITITLESGHEIQLKIPTEIEKLITQYLSGLGDDGVGDDINGLTPEQLNRPDVKLLLNTLIKHCRTSSGDKSIRIDSKQRIVSISHVTP